MAQGGDLLKGSKSLMFSFYHDRFTVLKIFALNIVGGGMREVLRNLWE